MDAIDLVIFDCDGVLIDSEIISARILIEKLAEMGIVVDFPYVQRHFLGRSWAAVAETIRIRHGLRLDQDFAENYRRDLLVVFETELKPTRGIEAVLDGLGVLSCVATSSSPRRACTALELTGLDRHFGSRVFTAAQVAHGKPAPDLFLMAADTMGVPPERCLVIEDSAAGIAAARAGGMNVWRYAGGSHIPAGATLPGFEDVRSFADWAEFYVLAPQLRGQPPMETQQVSSARRQ